MAEAIRDKINENNNNKNKNQTLLDKLVGFKREAYAYLDQALNLDSSKQFNEAVIIYRKCVQLLNNAINFIKVENTDLLKSVEANKIYQDLNVMLKKTLDRLELLEKDVNKPENNVSRIDSGADDFLLVGDEILNDNDKSSSLIEINVETNESNATEIYNIKNGVQLFYIATDGSVSTPSYPTSLSIYMFNEPKDLAKGFIRVGNWMYPLNPEKTPTMKTNYNAYIFPNSDTEEQVDKIDCKFVGVMFTDAIGEDTRNLFEDLLSNFSVLINQAQQQSQQKPTIERPESATSTISSSTDNKAAEKEKEIVGEKEKEGEEEKEPANTAEYISKHLINGAKFITRGVSSTTEFANKYINIGGEKIKTQLQPNQTASTIDPTLQKCVSGVRSGTNAAVRVSSFLVDKLGVLATKTAQTVAPYIKSGSTKLLTQTGIAKSNDTANGYLENVCTVASSSVAGFSIVYESLENAAKSLAKNVAQHSVQVVSHKYGNDAAKLAENTLYSAGNVALSAHNIKNLKITKTIAKAAAKETINSFSNQNDKTSSSDTNVAKEIKKN